MAHSQSENIALASEGITASASSNMTEHGERNVLGSALSLCSLSPLTGWFRDGHCRTGRGDIGSHTVCARLTQEFLAFTAARGNDLSTSRGSFPGLKPGDRWCLCAGRWSESLSGGVAPPVLLEASSQRALQTVTLDTLTKHQVIDKVTLEPKRHQ